MAKVKISEFKTFLREYLTKAISIKESISREKRKEYRISWRRGR